jgi:hypothetical protein
MDDWISDVANKNSVEIATLANEIFMVLEKSFLNFKPATCIWKKRSADINKSNIQNRTERWFFLIISGKSFMLKTFQFRIQKSVSYSNFLFTFNVYHKDESDLVVVWNESETDYNPRRLQGTFLSFFTNPIVKKSKADTKVKENLMTEMVQTIWMASVGQWPG